MQSKKKVRGRDSPTGRDSEATTRGMGYESARQRLAEWEREPGSGSRNWMSESEAGTCGVGVSARQGFAEFERVRGSDSRSGKESETVTRGIA